MIPFLIVSFVILAIFSVPIAIAVGIAVIVTMAFFSPFPVLGMVQRMVTGIDSFILLSIPFFMLTGRLMNVGGITDRIFYSARCLIGHVRGSLAHANVIASMIFAGMSGSAVADAGGLGMVEMKAMTDQGYQRDFSAAITVASSTIGPIIPPSIPMVIYGAMAEVSVGKLFLAGFLPGALMGLSLMGLVYIMSFKQNMPRDELHSLREICRALLGAFLPLLTPVIIVGGIVGGIFTPTEAAAVAAVYAFVLSFFVYKTITIKDIPSIIIDTLTTTAVVTFIISATSGFSWLLIVGKIGKVLAQLVFSLTHNPLIVLLILNIAMLFLGSLMEAGVVLILLIPILVPMVNALGIDLVHFGIIMVLNLMIGVATPPVGMSLFVVSEVSGLRVERLMRAVLPLLIPLIITLFFVTYFPDFVLLVPRWLMPIQ